MRQHGSVVVTIMSGGCVSEAKGKTERVRGTKARERGGKGVGSSKGEMGEGCRVGWRRERRVGGAGRASVGKRVASASTLFHPPTTLSLLLGPRGVEEEEAVEGEQGGQGLVRGW